jgi:hypothetical protein
VTKWLWALGLPPQRNLPTRPLVLDRRVWDCLNRMCWYPTGSNRAERWVSYCDALPRWAEALNGRHDDWRCDAYRLEQLLFDWVDGCFY